MSTDTSAEKVARDFVDGVLAERTRLGYTRKVSKKSYGRAVHQAAGVFSRLGKANGRAHDNTAGKAA
jgi:hypothetical protein